MVDINWNRLNLAKLSAAPSHPVSIHQPPVRRSVRTSYSSQARRKGNQSKRARNPAGTKDQTRPLIVVTSTTEKQPAVDQPSAIPSRVWAKLLAPDIVHRSPQGSTRSLEVDSRGKTEKTDVTQPGYTVESKVDPLVEPQGVIGTDKHRDVGELMGETRAPTWAQHLAIKEPQPSQRAKEKSFDDKSRPVTQPPQPVEPTLADHLRADPIGAQSQVEQTQSRIENGRSVSALDGSAEPSWADVQQNNQPDEMDTRSPPPLDLPQVPSDTDDQQSNNASIVMQLMSPNQDCFSAPFEQGIERSLPPPPATVTTPESWASIVMRAPEHPVEVKDEPIGSEVHTQDEDTHKITSEVSERARETTFSKRRRKGRFNFDSTPKKRNLDGNWRDRSTE